MISGIKDGQVLTCKPHLVGRLPEDAPKSEMKWIDKVKAALTTENYEIFKTQLKTLGQIAKARAGDHETPMTAMARVLLTANLCEGLEPSLPGRMQPEWRRICRETASKRLRKN